MEKHYVEKLIKIFEKERKNSNMITDDKYEKEVINLFELDKLNHYKLPDGQKFDDTGDNEVDEFVIYVNDRDLEDDEEE